MLALKLPGISFEIHGAHSFRYKIPVRPIFDAMQEAPLFVTAIERQSISSSFLSRDVRLDVYLPKEKDNPSQWSLLLLNDGQDLHQMDFAHLLDHLVSSNLVSPLFCVGIHAGERLVEYGTGGIPDCKGRGAKAEFYQRFLLKELLPFLHLHYGIAQFKAKAIAGFSLGGLMAIDTVWNHPDIFSVAGVFSGSLWWRIKDLDEGYNEETDRIMHRKIREGKYNPGLRFYFTTGSLDETADRNNNGIIDSIDDTLGLIDALKKKGYTAQHIRYVNYEDGRHDVATWGKAMPGFLLWGFGRKPDEK